MISKIARWTVEHDPVATALAFSGLPEGCDCECSHCRNIMKGMDKFFPEEFLGFTRELGIATTKPAELCFYYRDKQGTHHTGGWYHFVGKIVDGEDAWQGTETSKTLYDCPLTPTFSIGLTAGGSLVPTTFSNQTIIQLDWNASIGWYLPDEWEPECND